MRVRAVAAVRRSSWIAHNRSVISNAYLACATVVDSNHRRRCIRAFTCTRSGSSQQARRFSFAHPVRSAVFFSYATLRRFVPHLPGGVPEQISATIALLRSLAFSISLSSRRDAYLRCRNFTIFISGIFFSRSLVSFNTVRTCSFRLGTRVVP